MRNPARQLREPQSWLSSSQACSISIMGCSCVFDKGSVTVSELQPFPAPFRQVAEAAGSTPEANRKSGPVIL